jgi:hypothetical protein
LASTFVFGSVRQQAQDCERDEQALAGGSWLQPECAAQGVGLGPREAPEVPEHRANELVERRERELCLRLDSAALEHAYVGGSLAGALE